MNVHRVLPPLIAVGIGVMLSTAFAPIGWWFAPVPLLACGLVALAGFSVVRSALLAWLAGTAFFATSLRWVYVSAAAHLGWTIVPFALAACAVEALPFAFASAFAAWTRTRSSVAFIIGTGALATLGETARTLGPYGLPLDVLGTSQTSGPFAALLGWVGVPGVTFVIVGLAAALAAMAHPRQRVIGALASGCISLFALAAVGASQVGGRLDAPSQGGPPRIGVVRAGAIDAGQPFAEGVARYARMTERLRAARPDFIVWPEGVVFDTEADAARQDALLARAARDVGVPILAGATVREDGFRRNVILEQRPDGSRRILYTKRRPVPIGEAGYRDGSGPAVIVRDGVALGPLVCYEIAFPELTREAANDGARVMIAMENDSWFAGSDGPSVQTQLLRARTFESGIAAVQVDSVGPTGLLSTVASEGTLLESDGAIVVVPPPPGEPTFYRRAGPAPTFVAIGVLTVLAALRLARSRAAVSPAPDWERHG